MKYGRALLKRGLEAFIGRAGVAAAARVLRRGDTIILAYHNIVPTGESVRGEASLHLPQRDFARQLDLVARTHDVIPLAALWDDHPRSKPRAVITFDDAYQGAVTAGISELSARGLPATVFVAPALLEGRSFWWDGLADAASGELPGDVRQTALDEMRGKETDIRAWAARSNLRMSVAPPPSHQTGATWAQLERADATPGITLASHSWSHANLERLDGAELADELNRPLAWLQDRFEHVLPWVSYPYGRHSKETEEVAARAGYEGGLLIGGGWVAVRERPPRFAVPRLNVPAGISLAGFESRCSGVRR